MSFIPPDPLRTVASPGEREIEMVRRILSHACRADTRDGACQFPAVERFEGRALCGTHLRIAKSLAADRDRGWSPTYVADLIERAIGMARARNAKKCQPLLLLADAEQIATLLRASLAASASPEPK